MACLEHFHCDRCGYTVFTNDTGRYSLKLGDVYTFCCPKCRELIRLFVDRWTSQEEHIKCPKCPNCGNDKLPAWNPVEGKCPKCGGDMIADGDGAFVD